MRTISYFYVASEEVDIYGLEVSNLELNFGGIRAINDLSFEYKEHGILAIIGPNGAGKTALLNCISGFYKPQKGRILYCNKDIVKLPPHKVAKLGVARTFQNIELYDGMNTINNIITGRHMLFRSNAITQFFYFGPAHNEEIKHRQFVEEIIDFLEIEDIRHKIIAELPYGLRKRVELGRALALKPSLLLLDEPMTGMNLDEKEDMARFILDINELKGIPIILIEHDMGLVMDIASRVIVLDFGKKIAEGTPEEIKVNPEVIQAYLGVQEPQGTSA
jgi:branched-chain amino acid transport system ATP-binding protein